MARPYAALAFGWAVLIALLTLTPSKNMPRTPVWELLSFDTAAHAGVFAVLAVLCWLSLRLQARWPQLRAWAGTFVFTACIFFGGLIEVLQHTMRLGRHGDWTDLLSDGIGATIGVAAAAGLWALWRRRQRPPQAAVLMAVVSLAALAPPGTARAQDLPRVRQTIEKLASPEFRGRGYVGDGDRKAAAYLRRRFKELKLEPLAPDFTQPFTLDVNTFPGSLVLEVQPDLSAAKSRVVRLVAGADFIAAPDSGPATSDDWFAAVQTLDTLIFRDSTAARRYSLPLPGHTYKACLTCPLLLRARDRTRLATLPVATQDYINRRRHLVLVPKLTASLASQQAPALRLEILADKWPAYAMPGARLKVDAQLKRRYQTQNLAAVIRGRVQPDSFLVVSAHYDHLGTMGSKAYFPGANDNASGVAMLLELAAYYARPENRPACSIAFLLFGAEEAGLVGSRHFVDHPLLPLPRIKFLMNLDLLGTGEQGATIVNGKVHDAAYRRLLALNEAKHYLPALGARGQAANSDHFPFSERGVPAFFLYTRGGSTAYHDVHDKPAALSLAGFAGAFGLVRDFLNAMGASR